MARPGPGGVTGARPRRQCGLIATVVESCDG